MRRAGLSASAELLVWQGNREYGVTTLSPVGQKSLVAYLMDQY